MKDNRNCKSDRAAHTSSNREIKLRRPYKYEPVLTEDGKRKGKFVYCGECRKEMLRTSLAKHIRGIHKKVPPKSKKQQVKEFLSSDRLQNKNQTLVSNNMVLRPDTGTQNLPLTSPPLNSKSFEKDHNSETEDKNNIFNKLQITNEKLIQENCDLKSEIEKTKAIMNTITSANSELKIKNEKLQFDIQAQTVRNNDLESKISELSTENANLNSTIELQKKTNDDIKKRMIIAKRDKPAEILKDMESSDATFQTQFNENNGSMRIIGAETLEIEGLKTKFFDSVEFNNDDADLVIEKLKKAVDFKIKRNRVNEWKHDKCMIVKDPVLIKNLVPGLHFNSVPDKKKEIILDCNNILYYKSNGTDNTRGDPNIKNLMTMIDFLNEKGHRIIAILDLHTFSTNTLTLNLNAVREDLKRKNVIIIEVTGEIDDATIIINGYLRFANIVSNDFFSEFYIGTPVLRTFLMNCCFSFEIFEGSVKFFTYDSSRKRDNSPRKEISLNSIEFTNNKYLCDYFVREFKLVEFVQDFMKT